METLQPIKEKIEKALGIPFFIDNDANVAALGERWMGAGDNQPDVVLYDTRYWCWWGYRCQKANCFTVLLVQQVSLATSLLTLTNQSHDLR